MSIMIVSPGRNPEAWIKALKAQDKDLEIEVFPDIKVPEEVEYALSWKHPHGIFQQFPNLKVIASMGAGIDHVTEDREIAKQIKITRVIDEQLTKDMSLFVLSLVLEHLRNLSFHHCSGAWEPKKYLRPEDVNIGIMGVGVLGTAAAEKLINNGFNVLGWSKNPKKVLGQTTYHGDEQLEEFLAQSNILICLLPLTSETENMLKEDLFQKLPKGSYLINVARGNHLVEEDLLKMLDSEHLSGAALDVFRQEPLPETHPFWKNKKIKITPHIASVTHPKSVVPQILENYERMKQGLDLKNLVDRMKGY